MNWKQRIAVAGMLLLLAFAVAVAIFVPAQNLGNRLLHALLAIVAVGVPVVVVLLLVTTVLAFREAGHQRRQDSPR
jgi:amino acid transporter